MSKTQNVPGTTTVRNFFWAYPAQQIFDELKASATGLNAEEAGNRKKIYGSNTLGTTTSYKGLVLFLSQFKSPVTLILLAAAIVSFYLGDEADAYIIFTIILISSLLGFWQEKGASGAVSKLLEMVKLTATVLRDNKETEIALDEIVPGDVVLLDAGDVVPADGLIFESNELFADEAAFTGETFPAEKNTIATPQNAALAKRSNAVFMGSHIISGTAKIVVVNTGTVTEFGAISRRLKLSQPETDFERGIKRFGYMLMQITLILVVIILGINLLTHKPILDSFLFALAIAVGLTPQLLPAIISVNLAQGARRMAAVQVIVKKLSAIENFGSMNILCSDKTGTLTLGKVKVQGSYDAAGNESKMPLLYAGINANCQRGFKNPIDEAIGENITDDVRKYKPLDEIPYDFIRKRLSILTRDGNGTFMVCKGALKNILDVCTHADMGDSNIIPIGPVLDAIAAKYAQYSSEGFRTLGIATKAIPGKNTIKKEDETGLVFRGFVTLFDPPKPGIQHTIAGLQAMGISLKMITGDNALVAKQVSESLGISIPSILTGDDLRRMSDAALMQKASNTDVFAEIEPNQKERIILALKKSGNVVGYMGDGINDATALHTADIGISVATAVDVAKEAADIVLLNNDLEVLISGVKEGRITFANTMKYIFMATSANFGNMFSMAGASIFLPFLPLLPRQILLTNLLTDFPGMAISADNVDEQLVRLPRKWDIVFIRKFMLVFGILSSLFDFITFGVLWFILHAKEQEFQTGWFVESVVSATLIVLVVRTRKLFFRSNPGKYLLTGTLAVALFTLILPLLPFARIFSFVPLPFHFYIAVLFIVAGYICMAEIMKKIFYQYIYKKA